MEPLTVEQLTGWWPCEAHCREIHDLQDRLLGLEVRLVVREELLEDYRERSSSLGSMVHQMQQEKLNKREEGVPVRPPQGSILAS